MSPRRFLRPFAAAALLLWSGAPAAADTLKVPDAFATIQAAVDAALANASDDDVILIRPGDYTETVTITLTGGVDQERLVLKRKGGGAVRIRGVSGPAVRVTDARGVVLEDLVLESQFAFDGVGALELSGEARDVECRRLSGAAGDDVGVAARGSGVLGLLLEDCDFSGMLFFGFYLEGSSHRVVRGRADQCGLSAFVLAEESQNCALFKCRAEALGAGGGAYSGVVAVRGTGHRLDKVVAAGGKLNGFDVGGVGHVLADCLAEQNLLSGFALGAGQALLQDCRASGNALGFSGGGSGVHVRGGRFDANASHGLMLTVGRTTVQGADVRGNGGSGIFVDAGADRVTLRGNSLAKNGATGAFVAAAWCWLENNVAKKGNGLVDAGSFNGGRGNQVKGGGANDFE